MGNEKRVRPSWDKYFMDIAHVAASRSNCSRRTLHKQERGNGFVLNGIGIYALDACSGEYFHNQLFCREDTLFM